MRRSLLSLTLVIHSALSLHAPTVPRAGALRLRGGAAGGFQPTRSDASAYQNEQGQAKEQAKEQLATPTLAPKVVAAATRVNPPEPVAPPPPQSYSAPPAPPTDPGAEQLSGNVEQISSGGSSRVTELAQKNRLLLQQCRALKARVPEGSATMDKIDARIRDLEKAWDDYVHVTPLQQENLYRPGSATIQDEKTAEEQWEEEAALARSRRKRIPVTFEVECNVTDDGDRVLLSGDIEEFGAWNSLAAIPMTTTKETFPIWTVTVMIPAGEMVEYKYFIGEASTFIASQFEVKKWEQHLGNRGFKTPRKVHRVKDEFVWTENYDRNKVGKHQGPSFVYMHQVNSQDCFLDPEYACVFD
mmetsp:Transcript_26032/g.62098  ORF Transcript_26032/g.62098 Transcript_26032/m.62098 type:complete len:357 (+) Transcript_26032:185-1255(+)